MRLGALGWEGQGARARWRGRGMRGARGLEGRGSEGQCPGREGVGTGKGKPEGLAGVLKQTMSRWRWVVLGSWAVTNRS